MVEARFDSQSLITFTTGLFTAAGMDDDKATIVARLLVLTDMMGRRTHGLALCPSYLDQIDQGLMSLSGEPEVVNDTGATVAWEITGRERRVSLYKGEIILEVTPDPARPFLVETPSGTVSVVGTIFRVRVGKAGEMEVETGPPGREGP